MKKLMLFAFTVCSLAVSAQEIIDVKDETTVEGKNMLKLNLPALALKNITVQYERQVGKKITVAGTFRMMPKGIIPLKKTFVDLADDEETERQLNNLKIANTAFMPEVRLYVGNKGAFRGFYLAPFASIAKYDANLLLEYDDNGVTKTIPLAGSVNTLTGGLMMGAQWKLSKVVYLDWWILGPNYGRSNGDVSGQSSLTSSEQQSLRDELDDLDVPLTDFTYDVNANGAAVKFKGPWAGVRAGLCIAFRF
jgi:hypothetical protein